MKAGRYTQLNVGAIQAQWICSNREMTCLGMLVWIAAFPSANSSQVRDSKAFDVSSDRAPEIRSRSSSLRPSRSSGCVDSGGGGAWTAEVGP